MDRGMEGGGGGLKDRTFFHLTLPFIAIKSSNVKRGPPKWMLLVNVMALFYESDAIK